MAHSQFTRDGRTFLQKNFILWVPSFTLTLCVRVQKGCCDIGGRGSMVIFRFAKVYLLPKGTCATHLTGCLVFGINIWTNIVCIRWGGIYLTRSKNISNGTWIRDADADLVSVWYMFWRPVYSIELEVSFGEVNACVCDRERERTGEKRDSNPKVSRFQIGGVRG